MEKLELAFKIGILLAIIAVLGNITFLVETFYPLGKFIENTFGSFGLIVGKIITFITILIDCIAVCIVFQYYSTKKKK